ncbi:MAG: hypothetical protein VB062_02620 [Christensenella sp.]|nr:hypothetical protein [Christensenella sp.]
MASFLIFVCGAPIHRRFASRPNSAWIYTGKRNPRLWGSEVCFAQQRGFGGRRRKISGGARLRRPGLGAHAAKKRRKQTTKKPRFFQTTRERVLWMQTDNQSLSIAAEEGGHHNE